MTVVAQFLFSINYISNPPVSLLRSESVQSYPFAFERFCACGLCYRPGSPQLTFFYYLEGYGSRNIKRNQWHWCCQH